MSRARKLHLSREQWHQEYQDNTIPELAEKYNVSVHTIHRYLIEAGVETRRSGPNNLTNDVGLK